MTPRRRLSGEIYGNGVSYRVAVCRKRLRASRTIPRRQTNLSLDGYALNSPSVANDLITRPVLPRQKKLAAIPVDRALIGVSVKPDAVAQEKAEDA